MKAIEFRDQLLSFASVLNAAGAREAAGDLRLLCRLFDDAREATVAAWLKRIGKLEDVEPAQWGRTVGDLRPALAAATGWMATFAKKAAAEDFQRLLDMLAPHTRAGVRELVEAAHDAVKARALAAEPLRESVVDAYVRRLETTYEDVDAFRDVYGELTTDVEVRQQEAAAIATRFAERTPKSAPKQTSFERIWRRHAYYSGAEPKAETATDMSAI